MCILILITNYASVLSSQYFLLLNIEIPHTLLIVELLIELVIKARLRCRDLNVCNEKRY